MEEGKGLEKCGSRFSRLIVAMGPFGVFDSRERARRTCPSLVNEGASDVIFASRGMTASRRSSSSLQENALSAIWALTYFACALSDFTLTELVRAMASCALCCSTPV